VRRSAGLVPLVRSLDLEDVGAQVAEQHRAERAGEHAREVEDPDAGEEHAASIMPLNCTVD
jgi:hypothetical protein